MMTKKVPIVVAASGTGRSLQNFISKNELISVRGVITSNDHCGAIQIAKLHNIDIYSGIFPIQKRSTMIDLTKWIVEKNVKMICLAGFLKPFPSIPGFDKRTLNIHPSLLPKFGGKGMYGDKVHKAVIDAGESHSGATVHLVTDRYDEGKIIGQDNIRLTKDETASSLANKVFAIECNLYPRVVLDYYKHLQE